jgi:uncharacterized protein YdeI (YjbR/CyaY-like superfamily)
MPAKKQQPVTDTFCPESRKAWRQWLDKNHLTQSSVWLLLYKKESGKPTISWGDAVEEALCFGWIDSKRQPIDEHHFRQFFSKRKPRGTWSKVNKEKIKLLTEQGLMSEAGLECVRKAKQNGSWTILDTVEKGAIPKGLEDAFKQYPGSKEYFTGLSKSVRKMILLWIVMAQKAETRDKRINEVASLAAQQQKPKHIQ